MADGILFRGAKFTEGAILIGGHEEGIVAEAFGADLGFENLAPALTDKLANFLIRSEERKVAFETCTALVQRRLLHGFEELRAILRIGRADAGIDRRVNARSSLQCVAAKAAVIGEDPGLAGRDCP